MPLLRTLGRLALEGADLTRPQPLLVLTYLHLEGPVSREHVAQLFWPNRDRGRKNLSMALVRLRNALGDAVEERDDLLATRVPCDATYFTDAFQDGNLEDALGWYGGPFLPEAPGASGGAELEEWVLARRESFARFAAQAQLDLGVRNLERGEAPDAARCGRAALRLVRAHAIFEAPLLERLHQLLQRLASPDAVETARLLNDLDLAVPSPSSSPPLAIARPGLIGREDDVERVETALSDGVTRLVTVTGPAGVGKTSLAHEVAHRAVDAGRFRDGVRYVALETVREPGEVLGRLARSLGVADASDVIAAIRAALRDRDALVLVDNFEHVMGAAADLAAVATALPGPSFLVTSRSRLQLRDEVEIALEPLATESPKSLRSAAANLFVERARRGAPKFDPDLAEVEVVEEICRRLDGLPLAIELAAAHVRAFGLGEIRAMLDHRFELLRGGFRDAPDRQRSLVAAIDWSYQLLRPAEQRLFRHLAVFRGSFDLDAVVAVTGRPRKEVAPALAALLEHHLVKPASLAGEPARFQCLESVRAYAARRLAQAAETAEAERALARRLAEIAERAAGGVGANLSEAAWRHLALEADNLRGSLAWCRDAGDRRLGRRIVRHAWRFWLERGDLREARVWLEAFAPEAGDGAAESSEANPSEITVELRRALSTVLHELGEFAAARHQLEDLLAAVDEADSRRPRIEIDLAWVLAHVGELGRAEDAASRAARAIDAADDPRGAALVENDLGWIATYRGDVAEATRRFAQSLEHRQRAGDERGRWFAEVNLAWSAAGGSGAFGGPGSAIGSLPRVSEADLAAARTRCVRAADALRAREDAQLTAWAETVQAELAVAAGEAETAEARLPDVLAAWRRVGNADGLALAFEALAGARLALGDAGGAEDAARHALRIRERTGNLWGMARARMQLGWAAVGRGDREASGRWFREALELARRLGHRWFPAACREELAGQREAHDCPDDRDPGA